ncbi:hypothetical protein FACS189437_05960 [Bacteroidia bacterium]|nr:hypothetical protein FACS189437_05960 [Bacteroidia bacterium]
MRNIYKLMILTLLLTLLGNSASVFAQSWAGAATAPLNAKRSTAGGWYSPPYKGGGYSGGYFARQNPPPPPPTLKEEVITELTKKTLEENTKEFLKLFESIETTLVERKRKTNQMERKILSNVLKKGVDINEYYMDKSEYHSLPLVRAVELGDLELVKLLTSDIEVDMIIASDDNGYVFTVPHQNKVNVNKREQGPTLEYITTPWLCRADKDGGDYVRGFVDVDGGSKKQYVEIILINRNVAFPYNVQKAINSDSYDVEDDNSVVSLKYIGQTTDRGGLVYGQYLIGRVYIGSQSNAFETAVRWERQDIIDYLISKYPNMELSDKYFTQTCETEVILGQEKIIEYFKNQGRPLKISEECFKSGVDYGNKRMVKTLLKNKIPIPDGYKEKVKDLLKNDVEYLTGDY